MSKNFARTLTQPVQCLHKSITWDRGQKIVAHKVFIIDTDMTVYYFDPSSPWQRDTNKNKNGLLRQYFPKSELMEMYNQAQLDEIAEELNACPFKMRGIKTPAEVFNDLLH